MRAAVAVSFFLVSVAFAVEPAPSAVHWKKTVVDRVFRSEGVAVADVNRDGNKDVLVGDFWYEAPQWKRHPIRKFDPSKVEQGYYGNGLRSYSECMCCWADDINADGWVDEIIIGFPGKPAYWYENPRGEAGEWKLHEIWPSACNESPQFVDLLGNGKRVLVMGWQPPGKEHEGQMAWFGPGADPAALWEMHPISEPSTATAEIPGTFRFAHGLGCVDVNGDGRLDVVASRAGLKAERNGTGGWWEQPANAAGRTPWVFHPADLNDPVADIVGYELESPGKVDLISSSAHQFGIWAHSRRGSKDSPSFVRVDLFPKLVSETHSLQCVDLDGDGLKDLVTGKRWWSHGKAEPGSDGPAAVYWLRATKATGGIRFEPIVIDGDSGIGTQFTIADINGDGTLDVITSNKKGVFVIQQVR